MKILFEDSMPKGHEYLSSLGQVESYNWQQLQPDMLSDVDVLAIRSTTKITPDLLAYATNLSYVTTATAGTNHIDKALLNDRGVEWGSAAGCNARAVAEYVLSILLNADEQGVVDFHTMSVGIVGAGNVGSALESILTGLGVTVLICDPPLELAGDSREFASLEAVLACDVISLHVPLVEHGEFATRHLMSAQRLAALKPEQLLINACRGEVIDETALIARLREENAPTVALDVFDTEPDINLALVDLIWYATPHIAGHSAEGKLGGTQMVYEQICQRAGIPPQLTMDDFLAAPQIIDARCLDVTKMHLTPSDIRHLCFSVYDIKDDDRHFRSSMAHSNQFTALRQQYRTRREYAAHSVAVNSQPSTGVKEQLSVLGFTPVLTENDI